MSEASGGMGMDPIDDIDGFPEPMIDDQEWEWEDPTEE